MYQPFRTLFLSRDFLDCPETTSQTFFSDKKKVFSSRSQFSWPFMHHEVPSMWDRLFCSSRSIWSSLSPFFQLVASVRS